MNELMTERVLVRETRVFRGSGGVSAESRSSRFYPAFCDNDTSTVYLSRFADGRQAPCHLLDGLPDDLVVARNATGRVAAVKASVISGFVRDGCFYTREEAGRLVRDESVRGVVA